MATILPKKALQENPLALDDDHHAALVADPSISQFPQETNHATVNFPSNGSTASSTFATGGFNTPSFSPPPVAQSSNFNNTSAPTLSPSTTQSYQPQPVLTGAGSNAAQGADVLVENTNSNWINTKWRPAMGWMYMIVCITDFVIFPVLWSILQAVFKGNITSQWQPLTLQGAGLFHIAMGAVLGIAAYGRTKEKIENVKA